MNNNCCNFCLNKGIPLPHNHTLKVNNNNNNNEEIICPLLLKTRCLYCSKKGHTIKYCPLKIKKNNKINYNKINNNKINNNKINNNKINNNKINILKRERPVEILPEYDNFKLNCNEEELGLELEQNELELEYKLNTNIILNYNFKKMKI